MLTIYWVFLILLTLHSLFSDSEGCHCAAQHQVLNDLQLKRSHWGFKDRVQLLYAQQSDAGKAVLHIAVHNKLTGSLESAWGLLCRITALAGTSTAMAQGKHRYERRQSPPATQPRVPAVHLGLLCAVGKAVRHGQAEVHALRPVSPVAREHHRVSRLNDGLAHKRVRNCQLLHPRTNPRTNLMYHTNL